MHKRGYKVASVDAPINEVLAAGLILLSDWNQISNFHDPMCGSGTILVEASMIANNIPANIFRKRFGFEGWKNFDNELWEKIRHISLEKEQRDLVGNIGFLRMFSHERVAADVSRKTIFLLLGMLAFFMIQMHFIF